MKRSMFTDEQIAYALRQLLGGDHFVRQVIYVDVRHVPDSFLIEM